LDELVRTAEILFSSQVCAFISSIDIDIDMDLQNQACGWEINVSARFDMGSGRGEQTTFDHWMNWYGRLRFYFPAKFVPL
jgi:hypothetical protein